MFDPLPPCMHLHATSLTKLPYCICILGSPSLRQTSYVHAPFLPSIIFLRRFLGLTRGARRPSHFGDRASNACGGSRSSLGLRHTPPAPWQWMQRRAAAASAAINIEMIGFSLESFSGPAAPTRHLLLPYSILSSRSISRAEPQTVASNGAFSK